MSDTEREQKDQLLFMQLVLTFTNAAWQQMGKIKNPITDQVEKDLNQARFSIDILDMIRNKMQGNLSESEQQLIDKSISELQLNFVSEFQKDQAEQETTEPEAASSEEEVQADEASSSVKEDASEEKPETKKTTKAKPGSKKKTSQKSAKGASKKTK